MTTMNPGELNPFQAPTAAIGIPTLLGASSDAELIRRTYLGHEASVKSLGSLNYVGAFFGGLLTIFYALGAIGLYSIPNQDVNPQFDPRIILGLSTVFCMVGVLINAGLGYGLRNLQTWARWVTMVLTGLSLLMMVLAVVGSAVVNPAIAGVLLLVYAIPSLILVYVFYLMFSAKGAMVFSPEYRVVIRQTPHIKYKTSLLVKIVLGLFVALIVFGIIMAIINMAGAR